MFVRVSVGVSAGVLLPGARKPAGKAGESGHDPTKPHTVEITLDAAASSLALSGASPSDIPS